MRAMLCVMRTQGVTNPTLDSVLRHASSPLKRFSWGIPPVPADAAVDRARSLAATEFVRGKFDVFVMVDYDIQFETDDLEYLAEKAYEHRAVVGGIVSKKVFGEGFGGSFNDGQRYELYTDKLVELGPGAYVGGAFTAIARPVFESIIAHGAPFCKAQGFWPFFLPAVIQTPEGDYTYLSEDWAFCHYAREAGCKVYAALAPVTVHHGRCGFTALEGNAHG